MAYRKYTGRIGGINHWLFKNPDFVHIITRTFRNQEYTAVLNGSGMVKNEQQYPKGYQDVIIPELLRRSEFLRQIPALQAVKPAEHKVLTVLVGDKDDPQVAASRMYVGMKAATTRLSGLASLVEEFPASTTETQLAGKLENWNNDDSIVILMFQLPFGGQAGRTIDTTALCNRIAPLKDGDGLNQVTLGLMSLGAERYHDCCTPGGMLDLASVFLYRDRGIRLRPDGLADFAGLEVLVAGRSTIIGEPLFNLLKRLDATSLGPLHTRTGSGGHTDPETQLRIYTEYARRADLIFSCMGFFPYSLHKHTEYFFTPDMLKEGCLLIDASTSFRKDGKRPFGDVDPAARSRAAAYTLEIGGVGPATVTRLIHQGWRGMLYRHISAVRQALTDNKPLVCRIFAGLLSEYGRAAAAETAENAAALYHRAVAPHSHPVHAADALEALLPELMNR